MAVANCSPSTISIALSLPFGFPSVVRVCRGAVSWIELLRRWTDPWQRETTLPFPPVIGSARSDSRLCQTPDVPLLKASLIARSSPEWRHRGCFKARVSGRR